MTDIDPRIKDHLKTEDILALIDTNVPPDDPTVREIVARIGRKKATAKWAKERVAT